eukprot:4368736-Prorocentrum_lima.AAC.1
MAPHPPSLQNPALQLQRIAQPKEEDKDEDEDEDADEDEDDCNDDNFIHNVLREPGMFTSCMLA